MPRLPIRTLLAAALVVGPTLPKAIDSVGVAASKSRPEPHSLTVSAPTPPAHPAPIDGAIASATSATVPIAVEAVPVEAVRVEVVPVEVVLAPEPPATSLIDGIESVDVRTVAERAAAASAAGDPAVDVLRTHLVAGVAPIAGVDAVALAESWAAAGPIRERVVFHALAQVGAPYRGPVTHPKPGSTVPASRRTRGTRSALRCLISPSRRSANRHPGHRPDPATSSTIRVTSCWPSVSAPR